MTMAAMDASANRSTMMFDQPFTTLSAPQPNGSPQSPQRGGRTKRARTSEVALDPAKAQEKREKARERQRRKRERDKRRDMTAATALHLASFPGIQEAVAAASGSSNPIPAQQQHVPVLQQQQAQPPQPPPPPPIVQQPLPPLAQPQQVQQAQPAPPPPSASTHQPTFQQNEALSQEELSRRERVRAAARERQRKHRALVKQKKMAELGLAMGNDGVGGIEEMHYALGPDGQYQPVIPPQNTQESNMDQTYPQGHSAGQTFASTLLLSFSCSPLLKQHLLRTLHMTNEELASLEPVLSHAFDQWDHNRRVNFAEQAAKHQPQNVAGPSSAVASPFVPPQSVDGQAAQIDANDFRARFHRPLTAPSPFRNGPTGVVSSIAQAPAQIDPSLGQQQQNVVKHPHAQANGLANGINGTTSNADSAADGDGEFEVEEKDEEDVAKNLEA